MPRIKRSREKSAFGIVGRTLSRDAVMLSKVTAPEDAKVARAIAVALRDPQRVRALVDGIMSDDEMSAAGAVVAEREAV